MGENDWLLVWGEEEPWVYYADYEGAARTYFSTCKDRPQRVLIAVHPIAMQLAHVDAAVTLSERERKQHHKQQLTFCLQPVEPGQHCFSLQSVLLPSGLRRHWVMACNAHKLQQTWEWLYQRWCVRPEVVVPAMQLQSVVVKDNKVEQSDVCVLWLEGPALVFMVYCADQLMEYQSWILVDSDPSYALQACQRFCEQTEYELPDSLWVVGRDTELLQTVVQRLAWPGSVTFFTENGASKHSRCLLMAAQGVE
jgi:hypothetical protein